MPNLGFYATLPTAYTITRINSKGKSFSYLFILVVTQSSIRSFKCACGWDTPVFSMQKTIEPPSQILELMTRHVDEHVANISVSLTPRTTEIQ